jgi:hypothetical protein
VVADMSHGNETMTTKDGIAPIQKKTADYSFLLERIWNNNMDGLDVVVGHDFLEYVATANKYWDNECDHLILADEEAVVWYLKHFSPDVFCEEFMETFFDVEEEIPDYDYRDWKANPKFLLFASYINSRGGIDEWNWYRVFTGACGPQTTAFGDDDEDDGDDDGDNGDDGWELFSCSNWLNNELKRKPYMDWKKLKN